MPDFLDDITGALGKGARVTSGFRSQEEQDGLVARGVTRAKYSAHSRGTVDQPGAVDLVGVGTDPAEVSRRLSEAGFPVSRAIYETGHGKNQGTGAHIHVELGGPTKATPIQVAGSSAAITAAGTPDPLNAFQLEGPIREGVAKVSESGRQAEDVIGVAGVQLGLLQSDRERKLTQTVEQKDAILGDIETQTKELRDKTSPLFAKRAAIAHRQTELAEMSPIKRGFLSIFNRNYDTDRLKEMDDALAGEIRATGEEYDVTNKAENTLLNVIQQRYLDTDAQDSLHEKGIGQDIEIANRGWNLARQQLSDSVAGVTSGVEITRAQMLARSETLSQMTPGQVNTAISQGRRDGGTVMVNGVAISVAELQERGQQLEQQDLALKGQRIGVQSGQISLQRNQEELLISHMSSTDLKSAIDNDGRFRGVQLDQGMLTQAYSGSLQRTSLAAGEAVESIDSNTWTAQIDAWNGRTRDTIRRMQTVTGAVVPQPYVDYVHGMVARNRQYQEAIARAPEAARPRLRAQFLQDLGKQVEGQSKVIDDVVGGMTRNPDARVLIKGWMTGVPPTGEASVKGLIALVSGGAMPAGLRLSGPASAVVNAARKAVDSVYADAGGAQTVEQILAGGNKTSKEGLQRKLIQKVTEAVSATWDNGKMRDFVQSAPLLAKQAGHPAGRINMQDYRAAIGQGDMAGYEALATRLGLTVDQVMQIWGPNGTKASGYAAVTKGKTDVPSYDQLSTQLTALQTTGFLRALDSSPSATHDFKPSAALTGFMNSPGFQSQVGAHMRNIGHAGFGEMIADSISGGSLGEKMTGYGRTLGIAQGAVETEDAADIRRQASAYRGSPLKRASVILGAIPGLNQHDETLLLQAIRKELGNAPDDGGGQGGVMHSTYGGYGTAKTRSYSSRIDSIITSSKFQDPKLEKIRQTAAKSWTDYSVSTDNAFERFMNNVEDRLFGNGPTQ